MKLNSLVKSDLILQWQSIPVRQRIKMSLLVLCVLLFMVFIFWPAWVLRFRNWSRIQELKRSIVAAEAQIKSEPQLKREQEEDEKYIEGIAARLFSEKETQGVLGIVTEMGQRNKVSILSSQPVQEVSKIPQPYDLKYSAHTYFFALEGGYHALASFAADVENYPKLLKIEEFSIRPQDDKPSLQIAEIKLSAFGKGKTST